MLRVPVRNVLVRLPSCTESAVPTPCNQFCPTSQGSWGSGYTSTDVTLLLLSLSTSNKHTQVALLLGLLPFQYDPQSDPRFAHLTCFPHFSLSLPLACLCIFILSYFLLLFHSVFVFPPFAFYPLLLLHFFPLPVSNFYICFFF